MSRRQSFILTVLFIAFFSAPIFAQFAGMRAEEIENRRLADRPELTLRRALDADYYDEWTGYLNDAFPLRSSAIRTNLRIDRDVFGYESPKVFEGEQGWLYLKNSFILPCEAALPSARAATMFATVVDQIDVPSASVVAPSKFRIVPEFLGRDGERQSDCALEAGEELSKALLDNDIDGYRDLWSVIDPLGPGEDLYRQLDSHWRDLAAMAMLEEIATELDLGWNADDVVSKGNVQRVGDLTGLLGDPRSEETERLVLKRPGVKVSAVSDKGAPKGVKRFKATSSRKSKLATGETLVIHDSFFDPGGNGSLMRSFAEFSDETTYVHLDYLPQIDLVEMVEAADRVVIEIAERVFAGRTQLLVDSGLVPEQPG